MKNRGGKREGAGRPPGSGVGRTVTTSSISLPPELWSKLDSIRGDKSRSAWVANKIKKARIDTTTVLLEAENDHTGHENHHPRILRTSAKMEKALALITNDPRTACEIGSTDATLNALVDRGLAKAHFPRYEPWKPIQPRRKYSLPNA